MKKRMTQAQFQQIRRWVLRNGRPLEWARWQAMFEGGSRNQAAEVLSGYQNADGGFGWGLEPDCMNPQSSPYQTGSALALAEALQLDAHDPLYRGAFAYLSQESTTYRDGWPFTIQSNDAYPHAPWMGYDPKLNDAESFGLNLGLARQILTRDCDDKTLRAKAEAIVAKALELLFTQEDFGEMGVDAFCGWLPQLDFLPATAYTQDQIEERILTLIEKRVERDPAQWQEYKPRPSYFVRSRNDAAYPRLKDLVEAELDYLIDTCPEGDVWEIPWNWAGLYPEAFRVARTQWKGWKAIENIAFLMAFDRIEPAVQKGNHTDE